MKRVGSRAIWAATLNAKYVKSQDILECDIRASDSRQWKGFIRGFHMIKAGFGWKIGNGVRVSFWFDTWLENDPLCMLVDDIHPLEITWSVADVIHNGQWELHRLRTPLPTEVKLRIQSFPLSPASSDSLVWKGTGSGVPTARSFFRFLSLPMEDDETPNLSEWQWVWKVPCPQKIRFFIWMAAHDRLVTIEYRLHIGLSESDVCPRCHLHSESIMHLLRDCSFSMAVWEAVVPRSLFRQFMNQDRQHWPRTNVTSSAHVGGDLRTDWVVIFTSMAWTIWKARNEVVFKSVPFIPRKVLRRASTLATDVQVSLDQFNTILLDPVNGRWSPPPPGYLKLNVDGGYAHGVGSSGGVLRDSTGKWVWSFTVAFHAAEVLEAEILALHFGLQSLINNRISRVIIEMDSSQVVNLVHGYPEESHPFLSLLLDCKRLHTNMWHSPILYTPCNCNGCAHLLACIGHARMPGTDEVCFDVVPGPLTEAVKYDIYI